VRVTCAPKLTSIISSGRKEMRQSLTALPTSWLPETGIMQLWILRDSAVYFRSNKFPCVRGCSLAKKYWPINKKYMYYMTRCVILHNS